MGDLPIYTNQDGNLETLLDQKVAVLGYGAHGRAHALNLRDSGVAVQIGLYEGSPSIAIAKKDGFEVFSVKKCVQECAVLALLLPDEIHGDIYKQEIAPYIQSGQTLIFAHGFSVCFGQVQAPEGVGLALVSPKSTGYALRENYKEGRGVFALMGVEQDNSHKNAKEIALGYAYALGCGRVGILETTFRDETHCDLFGEQAVLCGGVENLLLNAFNTLVEAGYPKEVAYFECVQELKVIADLIYAKGLASMQEHISNTAEYGGLESGAKVIGPSVKERMQEVLEQIQNGSFAKKFLEEKEQGYPQIHSNRKALKTELLEQTGAHLRHYLFQ
ncbi:Ketol-acid reductoisomerase IlvC [Helicobacter sp. NHP19-003]|uniref:Ketol-acid reductoisomerase (NADP(+)) n=1 Tax=Helicobacter gastrocanis TaxID=2849641 RepID=A0ABM7S9W7_9HELI|nr:ketol-acid reductoisomerase [Helicobacter sp. NHP19-003]BCZ17351.1 Ketol-acid reductoisomerase IlvC [Helicobacter sp. NHP19-003]